MRYLKINQPLRCWGNVEQPTSIAIVIGIKSEEVITIDKTSFTELLGKVKYYVLLEYYKSLDSFLEGDPCLKLVDGRDLRTLLYTGVQPLTLFNVHGEIANQVAGAVWCRVNN